MKTLDLASRATSVALSVTLGACALEDNAGQVGSDTEASGSGETGPSGDGDAVSIFDVQQGMVPEGTIVALHEVVVTSPLRIDPENQSGAVMVQEAEGGEYSGIYLYLFNDVAAATTLQPGDVVNVVGEYTEFYELSEITVREVADIQVVRSGEPVEPTVVQATQIATTGGEGEAYEAVLVRIEDVEVTDAALGFGDFEVDGALIIDDFFMPAIEPQPGTTFDQITGILLYSFEEYRLAPRQDSDVDLGTGGVGAVPATIFQLQDQSRADAVAVGTKVRVENVVVSSPTNFDGDLFYVQDPAGGAYGGIAVFASNAEGLQVQIGDVITLEGRLDEYYDNSQLVLGGAADITRVSQGQGPAPTMVASAQVATGGPMQEAYEGVLVEIVNPVVTAPVDEFGEFEVDGALVLDDLFFAAEQGAWPMAAVDDGYAAITGIMTYSFETAKLAPRMIGDFDAQ